MKIKYEVRAVFEELGNGRALTCRVSEHKTLKEARKACNKDEHIIKVTRELVS